MGMKSVLECSAVVLISFYVSLVDSSQEVDQPVHLNINSLARIKFYLSDKGSIQLASEVIKRNTSTYNITYWDILDVVQLEQLNFSQMSVLASNFGVDFNLINLDDFNQLEFLLQRLDVSILTVYHKLEDSLADPANEIPKALESLGFDSEYFINIVFNDTEEELFTFLKSKNISLQAIWEALGKTSSDAYELLKDFVFAKSRENLANFDLQRDLLVHNISEQHLRELF